MRIKMVKRSVILIAALLYISLLTSGVYADLGDSLPEKRTFTESEIADYVNKFKSEVAEKYHIPNMGMALIYNGNQAYIESAGYENIENKTECDPCISRFSIASTTKLFTYLSIIQLLEKGKIDLNDNVFKYLDFELDLKYDEPIRIIDLMNHKGGFEESLYKLKADNFETLTPLREWLMEAAPKQVYKPGTYTAYSNYGACLLGQVVASEGNAVEEAVLEFRPETEPVAVGEIQAHQLRPDEGRAVESRLLQ